MKIIYKSYYYLLLFLFTLTLKTTECKGEEKKKSSFCLQEKDSFRDTLLNLPLRDILEVCDTEGFLLGISNHARLIGEISTEIADREFGYIVPANDFKQTYIHPRPERWRWDRPDAYLQHAREHNQLIRLHSPVGPQCSVWAKDDGRTPDDLNLILEEYVTALCRRYAKEKNIRWMDVVNETVCTEKVKGGNGFSDTNPGDWFGARAGTDKWENPWVRIGVDQTKNLQVPLYIDRAFELSNRYAPEIKQLINQHGRFEEVVWEKMKALVLYLRHERNRRVDGLGWQAHIDTGWEKEPGNLERLDSVIKWCHARNLEFHITEMNVWLKDDHLFGPEEQADTYEAVLKVLLENRRSGVVGLSFWNVRDEDTANPSWKGTLWDNNGLPRTAYYRIKRVLVDEIVSQPAGALPH